MPLRYSFSKFNLNAFIERYIAIHSICVEDFMNRNVKYIWHGITYGELKNIIGNSQGIRSFPLLGDTGNQLLFHPALYSNCLLFFFSNAEQKILFGSVQRLELLALLERQIGPERRAEVAAKRFVEAK